MKKSDFSYILPEELIAQTPLEPRDQSRLLCLNKETGEISHRHFYEIGNLLKPGDLLVLNDSRVLPARLYGIKEGSGAVIECLLLKQKERDVWEILVCPGKKARPGAVLYFGDGILKGEITDVLPGGNRLIRFRWDGGFFQILDEIGQMPLPPYITERLKDRQRYQTVYAKEPGSAAAPTAGLHFTKELLQALEERGVGTAFVTLHVGLGTFRPVKEEEISKHHMHSEYYSVSRDAAEAVNRTKERGGRVIAVGTTSCRTLESVWRREGCIRPGEGETDIFLYPGCSFGVLDGLVTNFHLPESTLIMLVCAFAGYDRTMEAYRAAVKERYRFFSFGDAMLIL